MGENKEKFYMLGEKCPHCNGNGKLPARYNGWRLHITDRDSAYYLARAFESKKECKNAAKEMKTGFFGRVVQIRVVAPDGEIVKTY